MVRSLSGEEVVAMKVLRENGMPKRAVARQLGVDEKAVRYRLERLAEGASDGRKGKPALADVLAREIEEWVEAHKDKERPINVKELFEDLVATHAYQGSYKSVLRFLRKHYARPRIRTWRRVETPPGAQAQTDWGVFTGLDLGGGP